MSGERPNAKKCAAYLSSVGVEVTAETAAAWEAQEKAYREAGRAHRRELKKSCGHFRSYWCAIYSDEGSRNVRYCSDCRSALEWVRLSPPQPPRRKRRKRVA